jgi:hypothetical protein
MRVIYCRPSQTCLLFSVHVALRREGKKETGMHTGLGCSGIGMKYSTRPSGQLQVQSVQVCQRIQPSLGFIRHYGKISFVSSSGMIALCSGIQSAVGV